MMRPLALSTMWMQLRFDRLAPFIDAAREAGFESVELSPVVTLDQLAELPVSLYGAVSALHHPCPDPGAAPELSDPDPVRRERAVELLRNTVRWAARLGARVVVVHLGRVSLDPRWENGLRARYLQAAPSAELLNRLLTMRAGAQPVHWDAAHRSLDEIVPFARARDVRLAFENGEWLFNLPDLAETRLLLDAYPETVGYWVDTGHATILERLGVGALREWLALAPMRLAGVHLHDVNGLRDHLLPGRGSIDWAQVAALVPPTVQRTAEVDWYYSADELREAAGRIRQIAAQG